MITEIGARATGKVDQTIDCERKIVLPGLINTHTHLAMTMFRGYADDMKLEDWLQSKIWPLELRLTPEMCHYGALLGCLEMIATGTTTFVDMYFFMEETAKAVVAAGLRAYLSYGVFGSEGSALEQKSKENTKRFINFLREMNHPRVNLAIGPHVPYSCSPESTYVDERDRNQRERDPSHPSGRDKIRTGAGPEGAGDEGDGVLGQARFSMPQPPRRALCMADEK